MFSSQVTFSRVTRQQVVGQLKSTNSIDQDVLFAAKEALIAPVKPLKIIGLWVYVTGGLMTLTIFLAVPRRAADRLWLAGAQARRRESRDDRNVVQRVRQRSGASRKGCFLDFPGDARKPSAFISSLNRNR